MKIGFLNQFFKGVAVKRLVAGEINSIVSHQHEFNVNRSLTQLFGKPEGKIRYRTKYLYFGESNEDLIELDSVMTWYDARERNPNRSEYRLYFSAEAEDIMNLSSVGDSLFLCLKPNDELLLVIAKRDSTVENQLYYLFDLVPVNGRNFESRLIFDNTDNRVDIVVRNILEKIGIEYESQEEKILFENLIDRFDGKFPSTDEFSKYARSTVYDVDPVENPDETLIRWYDRETVFFKMMERHIIKTRLKSGFVNSDGIDVDGFINFALSVINRRKSRAGMALENGIAEILLRNDILFDRTPETEHRNRPDFLFPSKIEYHDPNFPENLLTMLGAKTTSKDRWRQVLDEADRIKTKHLITLEPAISANQTEQMRSRFLQLVVPLSIQTTYTQSQRQWLFSVDDFIKLVKQRQINASQFSERIKLFLRK